MNAEPSAPEDPSAAVPPYRVHWGILLPLALLLVFGHLVRGAHFGQSAKAAYIPKVGWNNIALRLQAEDLTPPKTKDDLYRLTFNLESINVLTGELATAPEDIDLDLSVSSGSLSKSQIVLPADGWNRRDSIVLSATGEKPVQLLIKSSKSQLLATKFELPLWRIPTRLGWKFSRETYFAGEPIEVVVWLEDARGQQAELQGTVQVPLLTTAGVIDPAEIKFDKEHPQNKLSLKGTGPGTTVIRYKIFVSPQYVTPYQDIVTTVRIPVLAWVLSGATPIFFILVPNLFRPSNKRKRWISLLDLALRWALASFIVYLMLTWALPPFFGPSRAFSHPIGAAFVGLVCGVGAGLSTQEIIALLTKLWPFSKGKD